MTVDRDSITEEDTLDQQDKENHLCRLGDEAELLLQTSAFNSTVNQLVEMSYQGFVNSKPNDYEEREQFYHHYRALVDIVSTLQQRVAIRDEIMMKNEADNNNQEEQ
jgi:hypothetical protein